MRLLSHRVARRTPPFASAALAVFLAASALDAQAAPLVLEARGGAAMPIGSFDDGVRPGEGVGTDTSFGLGFALSGSGRRTITAGFSQHRFGCRDAGCRIGGTYVATGVDVGLRLNLATTGDVIPWVRVAGLTTRVELDDHPEWPDGVSELGFGGEAGVGVYIGMVQQIALNPGVRFAAVNTELPGGGLLRMRFLVADLGVAVAF